METILFLIIIMILMNTLDEALYLCSMGEGGSILILTISGMGKRRLGDVRTCPHSQSVKRRSLD